MKLSRWLFTGGRFVFGLLMIVATFITWRDYQQLGLYAYPAFLIIALALALVIQSLSRANTVEMCVIFAIILALEFLLVPAVHVHSDRHVRNVIRTAVNP